MMHHQKSFPARFLLLLSCFLLLSVPLLAEEDLEIEELVEFVDLDAPVYGDVSWTFPVSLEDLDPDLIRLANKHYLLESGYSATPLVKVKARNSDGSNGGVRKYADVTMQLQKDCYHALHEMSEAALEAGVEAGVKRGYRLYLKSAYRSYQTQSSMYSSRLKKNKGVDDGYVSMPGASDHQTGLGCDIIPASWLNASGMNGKMAKEPECQWMAAHCQEFGFILRYPEDKEEITEIKYEPWHFRYVGIPVATYIMENNLCLEEFTWELQDAIQDFLSRGGNPAYVQSLIQLPTDDTE